MVRRRGAFRCRAAEARRRRSADRGAADGDGSEARWDFGGGEGITPPHPETRSAGARLEGWQSAARSPILRDAASRLLRMRGYFGFGRNACTNRGLVSI